MLRRQAFLRCIGGGPAPKKPKPSTSKLSSAGATLAEATQQMPKAENINVEHETSADLLKKLTPEQIDKMERQIVDGTEREERLLNEDNIFQMDISTKETPKGQATKVFWKTVTVGQYELDPRFYTVQLDGRKVKAFETKHTLLLPTKDFAYAAAREWVSQIDVVNKTLMPLTDIASASAYHVGAGGVSPRIDYVSSFIRNDNTLFRADPIEKQQDAAIEPIHEWFEKTFNVQQLPRVEKLKYPNVPEKTVATVRGVLTELNLNTYQAVALCILCQYTASVILPLALLLTAGRVVSTQECLRISRMEEQHNVQGHGHVPGYHDLREADVRLKVAAAVSAWRLTEELSVEQCLPPVPKTN